MTTVASQRDGICRYCGLASGVSHGRAGDCVDALLSERNRLQEHVLRQQGGRSAAQAVLLPTRGRLRATKEIIAR